MSTLTPTIKQRAVNSAQKLQRKQDILSATAKRFESASFSDIRLQDVASDIGITKAALYRYFRNKEVLFLALYEQQLDYLASDINEKLKSEPLVNALCLAICNQPTYCKLSGILHTILECNLTVEEAESFKLQLMTKMTLFVGLIEPHVAFTAEQTMQRFFMLHQVIIGAWVSCHPSKVVCQAIENNPELSVFDLSFEAMMSQQIALLFRV